MSTSTASPSVSTGEISARLRAVRSELSSIVRAVDPRAVDLSDAVGLWSEFTQVGRVGQAGATLLAARAAEARAATGRGAGGAAEQAARDAGTSTGRARAEAETSARLEGLEATSEELRSGRLSAEQAGAIADAAAVNPDCEQDLIDLARRESLKRLKDEAARRKAERDDVEARERRVRKERSARSWVKDGRWNFFAHGPISDGADVDTAVERSVAEHFTGSSVPVSERERRDAYAFDGFIDLARRGMAGNHTAAAGGAGGTGDGDEGGRSPAATRARERPNRMALVRIDLAALVRGEVADGEVCEIAGLGPISVAAAREMLGDSLLKAVLTHGTTVAGVVHLNRVPTLAQKLALLWTSPACTTEGCDHTVNIEVDHRVDWAVTQHTTLAELEHGCGTCHDKKTYEGYAWVKGTGRRPLVPPEDPRHPNNDPTHPDHPRITAEERRDLMARARRAVESAQRRSPGRPAGTDDRRRRGSFDTGTRAGREPPVDTQLRLIR